MNNLNQDINKIDKKINEGNYNEALKLLKKADSKKDPKNTLIIPSLCIDIGFGLKREDLINRSINYLKEIQIEKIPTKETQAMIKYNIANGYSCLYELNNKKSYEINSNENRLFDIKNRYIESLNNLDSLNIDSLNKHNFIKLKTDILVNLANVYNKIGRKYDALEYYEKALKIKPNHGMALYNKGITLFNYSNFVEDRENILADSYLYLKKSKDSNNITHETSKKLEKKLSQFKKNNIEEFIKKRKNDEEFKNTDNDFNNFLIKFSLENKLYLNPCNFCQKCSDCIKDSFVIKSMIVYTDYDTTNDPFLILSSYLNQLKMDYVSSRFNLILSQYKEFDLNFVDKEVVLIDTLNNEKHNIKLQLLKNSFKNFFDIFDKIALFINYYFNLNNKEYKVNFKKIWYSKYKKNKKEINPKIKEINNQGLSALFDINQDIYEGNLQYLSKMRNLLTHRFLKVNQINNLEDSINEEKLLESTIQLAKLTRNAIFYLLNLIEIEEKKKNQKINKKNIIKLKAIKIKDNY